MLIIEVQNRAGRIQLGLNCNRKEKFWRIITQPVTKKSRRRYADHRERLTVNHERRPDNRRVQPEMFLPRAIAHDCGGRSSRGVVLRREQAAGKWPYPEGRKVISRHQFAGKRNCLIGRSAAAHAYLRLIALECRDLLELRRVVANLPVQPVRKQPPAAALAL